MLYEYSSNFYKLKIKKMGSLTLKEHSNKISTDLFLYPEKNIVMFLEYSNTAFLDIKLNEV